MKLIWMALLMAVGLLLSGCAGSQANEKTPTDGSPAAPNAPVASPPNVPVASAPNAPSAPDYVAPSAPKAPAATGPDTTTPGTNPVGSSPTPVVSQPQAPTTPEPGTDPCAGRSGDDLRICVSDQAVANKDVSVCTRLTIQDDRYKCFTAWCGSGSRDFTQCDKLTDYDDKLACRNKCNPNSNT
jgi:hypothetical protein